MENKEKTKQFVVTQSLRFPNRIMKVLYYCSILMLSGAAGAIVMCLITGKRGTTMGLAVVCGMLGLIWFVAAHLVSENS